MFTLSSDKKERSRISQLYDIVNTISSARDMKELLERTLAMTLKALSSDRGSIFLAGDDGKELFLKWSYNTNGTLKDVKKKLGEGVTGMVARDRMPLLVKDVRTDARFNLSNMYHDYKTNSFLCVPISTEARLIGIINVTESKSKKPYSEKDLKFLKIVADNIAVKIEKSYLLSELNHLKKKMESDGKFVDLGKFAGGISHELNNPLDGVIRYVNLALNDVTDDVTREYLLEAKGGLTRIATIIRSLLDLARKKKYSAPKMTDVNEVIKDCTELLRYKAMYKNVKVEKALSDDLPKIPDLGLESVFSNILNNAVDAVNEEGSINITTSLKEDFIEVRVSDTGCGIVKDHIERIFEPFFSTKDMTKGCGLGLSICYDIVKRYKGKIDVESEPGKGTKFTVYIPCAATTCVKKT